MSKNRNMDYRFLPQLFLRAPYYSFNGYDLSRLAEVLEDQAFRNAVWLASPEFYRVLEIKEFDFDQLKDKEKHTLYKYYNRMCFRPTPFGSFATFTMLRWGDGKQVKLSANDKTQLHLLPDQQLLNTCHTAINQRMENGKLMVSPSVYRLDHVFRYTKSSIGEKGKYSFSLESIAAVKFNADLLDFMGSGYKGAGELTSWIKERGECTEAEAIDYLHFLLDEQVLYNAWHGYVVGDADTKDLPQLTGWDNFWTARRLVQLDTSFSLAGFSAELKNIMEQVTEKMSTQPFYAALERMHEGGGPDNSEQEELSGGINLLALLSIHQQPEDLSRFIREFRDRFDREKVPLLIALDPDAGLPYGNLHSSNPDPGILENIRFPENETENSRLGWNPVNRLLFRRWIGDPLRDPWSPLVLNEEDIRELQSGKRNLLVPPQTQAVMYRNTGEHLLIEHAGGVAATSLIGRFSAFSDQVHGFCRDLADLEVDANPDVVFADIGALSDTHVDNINRRRSIYPYEIPVNVFPVQPEDPQIRPDDLQLFVEGDELILESIRLGKRVIPRLATAYNFRYSHLPVFRLLCDLQFQGLQAGLSFDLESFFPGLQFYPRVTSGRIVFSPAKWIFREAELGLFAGKDTKEALGELQVFRRSYHIPRHISIGAYDQQLVFDLAHTSEALFFLQCLKGMTKVTIQEYFMPDRSVISDKKPLAGQFIAFRAHHENIYAGISRAGKGVTRNAARSFMIGSNWLYLKIFCSPRAAETILAKVISPFITAQRKLIKNWFFIRYSDKGYHLRLRIHAAETDLGTLLVALNRKMVSGGYDKLVRDYQGDTYRREIERYSLRLIPRIEKLFCSGSELVTWFVRAQSKNTIIWSDFELGLLTAERMIGCFFKTEVYSLAFMDAVITQFMAEFRADKQLKTGFDTKYREMKPAIVGLLMGELKVKQFRDFLKQVNKIAGLTGNYSVEKRSALLADLIHMQLNRIFSVQQREQELLVYYCLQKHTLSIMARNKTVNYSA